MFYVICPCCNDRVEIPEPAVGRSRSDPWNVVSCDICDAGFDYGDDEVIEEDDTAETA